MKDRIEEIDELISSEKSVVDDALKVLANAKSAEYAERVSAALKRIISLEKEKISLILHLTP